MPSVLLTEIQDQVARKSRFDSEDMQKFESMAKCEHPCHPNTNIYYVVVLDEIWYIIKKK